MARFREFYNKVVEKPLTPEQREELLEIFHKNDKLETPEKLKNIFTPDSAFPVSQ